MSKIIDINTYEPSPQDRIFFDCNVWIMLLSGIGNYAQKDQKTYSNFFHKLQMRKVKIAINSMLVSEYANVVLRIGFKEWMEKEQKRSPNFKRDYFGTPHFNEKVRQVKIQLKQMLKSSEKFSDEFNALDFDSVLNDFDSIDFNDAYFMNYALLKGLKVVTRDRDFLKLQSKGIEVITHHKI